jgi:hypothetical protein
MEIRRRLRLLPPRSLSTGFVGWCGSSLGLLPRGAFQSLKM